MLTTALTRGSCLFLKVFVRLPVVASDGAVCARGTEMLYKTNEDPAGSVLKATASKLVFIMGFNLLLNAQLDSAYQLMCYFNNWPKYQPDVGSMKLDDIDPCLCTHLMYSFAGIWENDITMTKRKDLEDYKDFNALKKRNSKLKTLLSIGCWNFGPGSFITMVSTPESRHSFITSVIKFLRKYEFDGLNLAWQYPGCYGSPPRDKHLFTILMQKYIMNNWKNKGASPEKLIVGFPAYGHTFILSDFTKTEIGAPSNRGGHPGPYTKKTGFWAYYEICTFLKNGAIQIWNAAQQVPYAFHGNEWVGYDNIKSFHIKAQWLKLNNFGGAMIWAIDMDDYTGSFCDQGTFPLTSTLKKTLKVQSASCKVTALPANVTGSRNNSSGALEPVLQLSSK
ncbi:acidic mammalian chitinase-like isoform X2 [Grammomys surdaster]|uniref:acidic mammalian chitinase-like isoform X2 n=1 Tax=Grammomys surdaster TaxID=491861 RepID=UPI0010A0B663|nr:acidic mammalian chitinase-like isoform X2 [Grammomys surdaster]